MGAAGLSEDHVEMGGGGEKGEWSNLASHSGGVVMLHCFMPYW